jgi:hypothetical protein
MSLIKVNLHHIKCLMWSKPAYLLKFNQGRFVINVGRSTYEALLRQRVVIVFNSPTDALFINPRKL